MVTSLTTTVAIAPGLLCLVQALQFKKEIGKVDNAVTGHHVGNPATGFLQFLLASWSPAMTGEQAGACGAPMVPLLLQSQVAGGGRLKLLALGGASDEEKFIKGKAKW